MDNQQIWRIALEQSAIDSSCQPEDFLAREPRVVRSKPNPRARAYLDLPFGCDLTSYGSNVVASVGPAAEAAARRYVGAYPAERCFETPHLHVLEGELRQLGLSIYHMAEYFLPDIQQMEWLTCPYETRLLEPGQLAELYQPQWSNALCQKRKHLDRLAVGAFHQGELVGLAGCSADCDAMWQIGVDVLPAYRRQGIASAVTSQLAHAVFQRGKVPFYCAAWSNIKSVRNALRCGFKPAWVQMTAKPVDEVERANQKKDEAEKSGGMELFEWPEELETGIALLDEQHHTFLRQVNRFYIKFRFKQQRESAEEQLDFLQHYLLSHFQTELAFMLEHGYPKAREHQASHQMLAIQVKQQALELKAQDYSPESVEAFCLFVEEWARLHVMQEDMEFCRFLRAAR